MFGQFDYADLFNEANDSIDTATIDDLTVTSALNLAGAVITGLTINTANIADGAVTNSKLAAGAVTVDKLSPLPYIPLIAGTSTIQMSINDMAVADSKFITEDSTTTQYINSDLSIDGSFILNSYLANSVVYTNASKVLETLNLPANSLVMGTSSQPVARTITSSSLNITNTTGNINIEYQQPTTFSTLTLDNPTSNNGSDELIVSNGTKKRYILQLVTPETGSNYGSDLQLMAYDNNGNSLGSLFSILRHNGKCFMGLLNILSSGSQLSFGLNNPPTNYQCTFNVALSSSSNTVVNFPNTDGSDTVVYENLSQTLNNKTLTNTTQMTNGTPTPVYITTGNGNVSVPQLILQGYLDNTQQFQLQYDTVNNKGLLQAVNAGGVIPIVLGSNGAYVSTGKDFYCTSNMYDQNNINVTSSAIFDNLAISYNTVTGFGQINASTNPLLINNGGGITSFNNTNGIVTYTGNTNGVVFIYGTFGSTDASSDTLHIREDTDKANPREVFIGYNANNDYGVIQVQKVGIAPLPLFLNPLGAQVIVPSAGIQIGNPGSILSPFIEFISSVWLYFNGVAAVQINIAIYQINHKCTIMTSAVNLSGVSYTLPIYFAGIHGYTPNYNWYSGSGPSTDGTIYVNGGYYQTRNVYDSEGGTNRFYTELVAYNVSSINTFIMDGWTLTYYI